MYFAEKVRVVCPACWRDACPFPRVVPPTRPVSYKEPPNAKICVRWIKDTFWDVPLSMILLATSLHDNGDRSIANLTDVRDISMEWRKKTLLMYSMYREKTNSHRDRSVDSIFRGLLQTMDVNGASYNLLFRNYINNHFLNVRRCHLWLFCVSTTNNVFSRRSTITWRSMYTVW